MECASSIWPSASARIDERAPWRTPGRPLPSERGACGLDADEAHVCVVEESVEDADRVRAAADAGDDGVGQAAFGLRGSARAPRRRSRDWSSRTISGYGAGPTHEPIR